MLRETFSSREVQWDSRADWQTTRGYGLLHAYDGMRRSELCMYVCGKLIEVNCTVGVSKRLAFISHFGPEDMGSAGRAPAPYVSFDR